MKKCILFLLIVLLAATLLALPVSSSSVYFPDVDGDGKIGSSDARLILRNAVGLAVFSDAQKNDADYDKDGAVTAEDARTALRTAVGLHIDMLAQSRIFRSDNFVISGTYTKNNSSADFELAIYGQNMLLTEYVDLNFSTDNGIFDPETFSLLVKDGSLYFINPVAKLYCPVTEDVLTMFGYTSKEEYLKNLRILDLFKLSDKDEPTSSETVLLDVHGSKATSYSFITAKNTIQKHYVDEKGKLIRVLDFDKNGGLIAYIDIESISSAGTEEIITLPADYIETGFFDFIASLAEDDNGVIIQ